jgi:hypothetical protein
LQSILIVAFLLNPDSFRDDGIVHGHTGRRQKRWALRFYFPLLGGWRHHEQVFK